MKLTLDNLNVEQLEAVLKTLKKLKYEPKPTPQTLDGKPEPNKPKE